MDTQLHRELQRINTKLDQLLYIKPVVEKHQQLLYDEDGLIVKVDRLVQAERRHKWAIGIVSSGFVGVLAEWFRKLWA